jgi:colicin import membrane protein
MPETALATIDTISVVELFTPGFVDPTLEAIRSQVLAQAKDLTVSDAAHRKTLASLAYGVAKQKTFVDQQRKAYVGEQKKKLAAIDSVGKHIWDVLEGIQGEVRKPLTDWEDAEKARVQKHEDGIAAIWEMRTAHSGVADVEHDIQRLTAIDPDTFEEFANTARGAKSEVMGNLHSELAQMKQREAERAELEKLRAESEARRQQDAIEAAAEQARVKAEAEARQAEERAQRAEQARLEAEKAAERRAEEAVERERQRVAAEEKAAQAEAERRAANKKHREKVHTEVRNSLIGFLIERSADEGAHALIDAIASGLIPHVSISY